MKVIFLNHGTKLYVMPTTNCNKSKKLTQTFIFRLGMHKGAHPVNISNCINNEKYVAQVQYNLTFGNLEERSLSNGTPYYIIYGKDFSYAFPPEDFKTDVVMLDVENTFLTL